MRKVYKAMYKCRLCGEVFTSNRETEKKGVAVKTICDFCNGKHKATNYVDFTILDKNIHSCKEKIDGSIGLADFIGFKAVEE